MENIAVLITGAGAPGAPGIIKSLRLPDEREIRIIGVDMNQDSVGFSMVDKGYVVPPAADESFICEMLAICQKEKVDVVIPLVTRELMQFAWRKDEFAEIGTAVSISNPQSLGIANNKYLLLKHCARVGIPFPQFIKVDGYDEFQEAVFKLGYPDRNVCFKPPVSNGLRGFRILTEKLDRLDILINQKPINTVTTLEDIAPVLRDADPFPQLLVMEYLPGREYSVDVLADNGDPVVVIPRLRERIRMGISFVGITENNERVIEASRQVIKTLDLNGNIGLQFREDENGIPKIIESNPRVQGTIVLCTAAGANMVYLAAKLALGEKVEPPAVKWNTKMIRYWEEIYYEEDGHSFTI